MEKSAHSYGSVSTARAAEAVIRISCGSAIGAAPPSAVSAFPQAVKLNSRHMERSNEIRRCFFMGAPLFNPFRRIVRRDFDWKYYSKCGMLCPYITRPAAIRVGRQPRMRRSCTLAQEGMCLMPAISIMALMVTRCSILESTSSIPRTVIASGG